MEFAGRPLDQLILELYVKDLKHSIDFYTKLGFSLSYEKKILLN